MEEINIIQVNRQTANEGIIWHIKHFVSKYFYLGDICLLSSFYWLIFYLTKRDIGISHLCSLGTSSNVKSRCQMVKTEKC